MVADPSFWTLVAFAIFVGLAAKPVTRIVKPALDARVKKVEYDIEHAARYYNEAQEILLKAREMQAKTKQLAQEIIQHSENEAERLRQEAKEELERFLRNEEHMMLERIHRAEHAALEEVRKRSLEVALNAAEKAIQATLSDKQHEGLVNQAAKTMGQGSALCV